jgi:hypothetical protein
MANIEIGPDEPVRLRPAMENWPEPGDIPSLDELSPLATVNLLLRELVGLGPFNGDLLGRRHFINLVRVTEKALREYQFGHVACEEFRADGSAGRFSPYFRAIDNFESCIGAIYRSLLYLERLRRLGVSVLPFTASGLSAATASVRAMRDRIEHGDQDIAQGRIHPNADFILALRPGRMCLGDRELSYLEPSEIIRKAADAVDVLMRRREM